MHQSLNTKSKVTPIADDLYLIETAFNRDLNDSEKDWNSDGPALSWLDWDV